jgi:hypothetical protein
MSVLKLLTLPQVGKIVGLALISIYYHIRRGHLAATQMAGLWLVRESAAKTFKAERDKKLALRRKEKHETEPTS